jgi:hypothetical protein
MKHKIVIEIPPYYIDTLGFATMHIWKRPFKQIRFFPEQHFWGTALTVLELTSIELCADIDQVHLLLI